MKINLVQHKVKNSCEVKRFKKILIKLSKRLPQGAINYVAKDTFESNFTI